MVELKLSPENRLALPQEVLKRWNSQTDGGGKQVTRIRLADQGLLVIPTRQIFPLIETFFPESQLQHRANNLVGHPSQRAFTIAPPLDLYLLRTAGEIEIPYHLRRVPLQEEKTVLAEDLNSAFLILPSDTPHPNLRETVRRLVPEKTLVEGTWIVIGSNRPPAAATGFAYTDWLEERGQTVWQAVDQDGSVKGLGATQHAETILGREIELIVLQDTLNAAHYAASKAAHVPRRRIR